MRVTPNLDTLNSIEIHPRPGKQIYPAITFNGENYVVVWGDKTIDTLTYYITTSRLTPGGVILDSTVIISYPVGSSDAIYLGCAYDGNRCLVAWPQSSRLYGRFVNRAGQPEGNVFNITSSGSASGTALAFGNTNYLCIWFTGSYPNLAIYGQLVSTQGTLIGPVINITQTIDCHRWPCVVFDGTNFLAVWMTGPNSPSSQSINGQFISQSGSLIGGNFRISDNTTSSRWWPAVAPSDSNFLVAWGQGSMPDIYGNVDTRLVHIEEESVQKLNSPRRYQTIFSGPRLPITDKVFNVYDIMGRQVDANHLKPGIYFVETEGSIRHKIIKIK